MKKELTDKIHLEEISVINVILIFPNFFSYLKRFRYDVSLDQGLGTDGLRSHAVF